LHHRQSRRRPHQRRRKINKESVPTRRKRVKPPKRKLRREKRQKRLRREKIRKSPAETLRARNARYLGRSKPEKGKEGMQGTFAEVSLPCTRGMAGKLPPAAKPLLPYFVNLRLASWELFSHSFRALPSADGAVLPLLEAKAREHMVEEVEAQESGHGREACEVADEEVGSEGCQASMDGDHCGGRFLRRPTLDVPKSFSQGKDFFGSSFGGVQALAEEAGSAGKVESYLPSHFLDFPLLKDNSCPKVQKWLEESSCKDLELHAGSIVVHASHKHIRLKESFLRFGLLDAPTNRVHLQRGIATAELPGHYRHLRLSHILWGGTEEAVEVGSLHAVGIDEGEAAEAEAPGVCGKKAPHTTEATDAKMEAAKPRLSLLAEGLDVPGENRALPAGEGLGGFAQNTDPVRPHNSNFGHAAEELALFIKAVSRKPLLPLAKDQTGKDKRPRLLSEG